MQTLDYQVGHYQPTLEHHRIHFWELLMHNPFGETSIAIISCGGGAALIHR